MRSKLSKTRYLVILFSLVICTLFILFGKPYCYINIGSVFINLPYNILLSIFIVLFLRALYSRSLENRNNAVLLKEIK